MIEKDEIDLIHAYWQDQSQDPEFISEDTGIDLDRVMEILQILSKEGKIKDFQIDESKILLYEELVDLDDYFALDLDKISTKGNDTDYFFSDMDLNKTFNKGPFTVLVRSKHFQQDYVILDMDVSYMDETYPIFMYYDRTERVFFLTPNDTEILEIFYDHLGENLKKFHLFCEEILDRLIPFDFWDTRAKFN